jgi:hypothetical protein
MLASLQVHYQLVGSVVGTAACQAVAEIAAAAGIVDSLVVDALAVVDFEIDLEVVVVLYSKP